MPTSLSNLQRQELPQPHRSPAFPKGTQKSTKKPHRKDNQQSTKAHVIPLHKEVAEPQQPKSRDTELLEQMNRKHAVVPVGSKVMVLTEKENPQTKWKEYSLLTFAELSKLYSNQSVMRQRVGEWWLNHPERREYKGIIFSPGKDIP